MPKVAINQYIVADPNICHGKPTFKGTRVMVWQVLGMLAGGQNIQAIKAAFPQLTERHIKAALEYASLLTKENYVILNTEPPVAA